MIELDAVTYKYPRSGRAVIEGCCARFDRGEIVAVTGPNGCGKTTLTKLIVGVLRPQAGRIAIDGRDTAGLDLFAIGRLAGYIFQNPARQLFCDTVEHEVAYGLENLGLPAQTVRARTEEYLELLRLSHLRQAYPGRLSQGEKQRLMLAATLALGTRYLILDEPTTGLDVRTRHQLEEMLRTLRARQNCGIVVVSHEREFISRCADREMRWPL